MKNIYILASLLLATFCCYAQNNNINPAMPHYKILKADSTYTTWAALNKNKPVMIIYFMPDCPHCQHLMDEIKQNMGDFKNIQIVLITDTRTAFPYMRLLRDFSKHYELPKYKNITMGTEYPTYTVNEYYRLQTTPFIAIYERSGKMIKYFDKPVEIGKIIAAVKKA